MTTKRMTVGEAYQKMQGIEEAFKQDRDRETLALSLIDIKPTLEELGRGITAIALKRKDAVRRYNELLRSAAGHLDGEDLNPLY